MGIVCENILIKEYNHLTKTCLFPSALQFLISDKDDKITNEVQKDVVKVKDANEDSSSTDNDEVKENIPEAKNPDAGNPIAENPEVAQADNAPESSEESTETKEGSSSPKVLEPVIIVEDKKNDDNTTNF